MDAQVLECLRATLSPDERTRHHAEQRLAQLFLVPDGGFSLARLLVSPEIELPQRQMILLQKYIAQHWYPAGGSYNGPETPAQVKDQIRPIIFHGLSDPERKIRASAAFALSTIAHFDWPDDYPDLLNNLVSLLTSNSPQSVDGALRVATEFVKNDLYQEQILHVFQDLVPALLSILGDSTSHCAVTRAMTVNVFRQAAKMLETVREEHPSSVKEALDQLFPQWFSAFHHLLSIDAAEEIAQSWASLAIRIEIFRTFNFMINSFPRVMNPELVTYLQLAIQTLTSLLPTFQSHYLSTNPDAPEPPTPSDSSATKQDIDDLASTIFLFMTPAVRNAKIASSLVEGSKGDERPTGLLRGIVEAVLDYTQVTRENEEEWMEDPNAFAQDNDEETELYGLRVIGHDLIGSLIDRWPGTVARVLQDLTEQKVNSSAEARNRGDTDWWKPLESMLSMLGGVADDIMSLLDDERSHTVKTMNVQHLFDHIVPGLLDQSETPFLQGRAFVFASQFASTLSDELATQYLAAAVTALESPNVSVTVKISAVRTVKNFCRHVGQVVIQTRSAKILTILLPLLPEADGETLYLILETIRAVLSLDKELLTPGSVVTLTDTVYQIWLKHTDDPVLTAIVEELYESIAGLPSPEVVRHLVLHVSPRLAAAISTPTTEETLHLPGEALQLANALIRNRGGSFEPELVATITSAVLLLLQSTDDMDVIQHGVVHLTYLVRKDCDRLIQWHDRDGNNGIAAIFGLLGRFLAPTFSESGGIFVGELIMHLFRKAGPAIGPVLPDLLRAVAQRLATAEMPSFAVSLVMPFAYLFGTEHTQSTIDLLSQFTVTQRDGSGKSALAVVLSTWCETCDTLAGSWDIRVSAMGMSKLFVSPDQRLRDVVVKGDMMLTKEQQTTIMTRSKTQKAPIRYSEIPFPVRALKLILKDVENVGRKGHKAADLDNIEEDDGDEEWDDDDPLGDAGERDEFGFLSSWIDAGKHDDAQDDDEDLKSDLLAQIDMGGHLTDVLRGCYASNENGMHEMIEALTDVEKGILRGVLTV